MNLIAADTGRVVHLVVPDEIRPINGIDLLAICRGIAARYDFSKVPQSLEGFIQPTGLKFEQGRLSDESASTILISDLSLFNDGMIVTCANTELAEAVVDDVLHWLISSGSIRIPKTLRPRTYTSNIVVEFDKVPPQRLSTLFKTTATLNRLLKDQYGVSFDASLARLAFMADPKTKPSYMNFSFVLERRPDIEYDRNWFWSSAPLKFANHIALLEAMEADLSTNAN